MLQKTRELLVLALIIVLPFHALLVTVGTRLLAGAGQAPLPWLAGWKEAILAVVLAVAFYELTQNEKLKIKNEKWCTDMLDWLVIGLLVLGIVTTNYKLLTTDSLFGAKYTLFPLFLFLILRRVPWSERNFQLSAFSFQVTGILVAIYGVVALFLPAQFFTWLGYSDLHSTYLPDGPLAAFQYLEGTGIRRMQATFAGPNQLGMWLLIPWSVAVMTLVGRLGSVMVRKIWLRVTRCVFPILIIGIALFFTFSRAAWVGAVVILLAALMRQASPRARCRLLIAGCSFLAILLLVTAALRPRSTVEHFRRPLETLRVIAQHPLGLGLGAAGPAANRTSDPCVYLEEGADSSWAKDRPDLCVFIGDRQIQPFDSAQGKPIPCRCPFLPENWYLQVGVELGVLGLVLYLALVALITRWLVGSLARKTSLCLVPRSSCLAFLGISVAALFLHAWEDSAVAYTVWILVAAVLPSFNHRLSSPSTIVC